MELSKLEITPLDKAGQKAEAKKFAVLFNPNTYSISKSVKWNSPGAEDKGAEAANMNLNAPTLSYGGGTSRTLTLELFYDVTETGDDVRVETNKIVKLTLIDRELKRPPAVSINWGAPPPGEESDFPFNGVVSQLTQRFTMFRSDGRPVRATLTVQFTEYLDPEMDQ